MKLKPTVVAGFLATLFLSFAGCGSSNELKRYALSGTITMADGKPAPAGEISFEPDSKSGNSGPGSMTQIKDGKYSLPSDQGHIGGKYIVSIIPFDGIAKGESLQGLPLVKSPYTETIELPAKNGTQDFQVKNK